MAVDGVGRMKAREELEDLQDEAAYLNCRMRENEPEMRSQGLIELSTMSNSCTAFVLGSGCVRFHETIVSNCSAFCIACLTNLTISWQLYQFGAGSLNYCVTSK